MFRLMQRTPTKKNVKKNERRKYPHGLSEENIGGPSTSEGGGVNELPDRNGQKRESYRCGYRAQGDSDSKATSSANVGGGGEKTSEAPMFQSTSASPRGIGICIGWHGQKEIKNRRWSAWLGKGEALRGGGRITVSAQGVTGRKQIRLESCSRKNPLSPPPRD